MNSTKDTPKDDGHQNDAGKNSLDTEHSIVTPKSKGGGQERRIIAEDPEWNLAPIEKLTALCVKAIVANFEKKPILEGIPEKYRDSIIESIPLDFPLSIAGPLIPDPSYWKRRTKSKFQYSSVTNHGNSWKRMFFELHLRDVIENFKPTTDTNVMSESMKQLQLELFLAAPFVETLKLRKLKPIEVVPVPPDDDDKYKDLKKAPDVPSDKPLDHLELGGLLVQLKQLKEFSCYYGLTDCGMDFSWSFFGMTLKDSISLCAGLEIITLTKLAITASGIDDDRCRLISHSLLDNSTLKHLDLSHNKISQTGARGLAKLLASPKTVLEILKVSNNQIEKEGAKCIGKSLQVNNTLFHLDLRLNYLHDQGGHFLLLCLVKNKQLKSLDLSGNGLEMKSTKALAVLLKHNLPTLTGIDVSCNKLGDYVAERTMNTGSTQNLLDPAPVIQNIGKVNDMAGKILFEATSQNKYLTSFDLRTTGLTPEYLVAIQGIVTENSHDL